jgi:hypothetical protein
MNPEPQSFHWEPPQAPRRARRTPTRVERVRDLFLAQPNVWLDGRSFETEGGCYAWRSRISDVRRQYGLVIENRQRTVQGSNGPFVVSEYRLVK